MSNEIDGMKVVISADASQAIRTIQDFQNKFRSMANSINGTMIDANVNMGNFTNSVQDMGSIANIVQMQKMRNSIEDMNESQLKGYLEANKNNDIRQELHDAAIDAIKRQDKSLEKSRKSWISVGIASAAALYGIIRMSSLAQMWMSELSGIFGYFIDTALSPLSPIIEIILNIFWQLTDWFSGLDPIIQGAVGALGLLGIAFGAVVGFISWLTGASGLSVITGAFSYIAGAIAGIAAIVGLPVEAVIIIIAAVGVALYLLWKNWDEIIAYLGKGWDWLGTKISSIWEGLKSYLSGVWEGLKTTVANAWNYIKDIITNSISERM